MRIAMISEHASPLAALGGVDAGGQNVHVAELAAGARRAAATRSTSTPAGTTRTCRSVVPLAPAVDVVHVPAGPPRPLPKDDLLPHMQEFGRWLAARLARRRLAAGRRARALLDERAGRAAPPAAAAGVPVVQTFHALGVGQAAAPGRRGHQPAGPDRRSSGRSAAAVDRVVATCHGRGRASCSRLGVPAGARMRVVPCGVDIGRVPAADGPVGRRAARGAADPDASAGWSSARASTTVDRGAAPAARTPSCVVVGGPPARPARRRPDARRLRALAARLRRRRPGAAASGRVAARGLPALVPLGRRRRRRALVRAVRLTPLEAMACGVPVVGHRGRRADRHRRRRRHRRSRAAARPAAPWPRALRRLLADPACAAPAYGPGRRWRRAAHATRWERRRRAARRGRSTRDRRGAPAPAARRRCGRMSRPLRDPRTRTSPSCADALAAR